MATTIISRLTAWLQQEAGGLGLREVRSDGLDPAAHPAAVLRLVEQGGRYPVSEQRIELRVVVAGARPAELMNQLGSLSTAIRARISRFCLEQPELRSIRWQQTSYPRPASLAGGPVLASSVTELGLTAIAGNAQEVNA
ncbi:hypothetical protein KDL29_07195 [bacterium]|nr:hypothetical protein [bacterium]